MRRGEVWWADLPAPWGRRPVLLLARDEAYGLLTWLVAAPLTTRIRVNRSSVPLEPGEDDVPESCIVNVDGLQAIRVDVLVERVTRLRPEKMRQVERAIHFALALRDCAELG